MKNIFTIALFIVIGSAAGYILGWYFAAGCFGAMVGLFVGAVCVGGNRSDLEIEANFWMQSYYNIKDEQVKCVAIRHENARLVEDNKQLEADKEALANKLVDLEEKIKTVKNEKSICSCK